jgi:hypothetical protein
MIAAATHISQFFFRGKSLTPIPKLGDKKKSPFGKGGFVYDKSTPALLFQRRGESVLKNYPNFGIGDYSSGVNPISVDNMTPDSFYYPLFSVYLLDKNYPLPQHWSCQDLSKKGFTLHFIQKGI